MPLPTPFAWSHMGAVDLMPAGVYGPDGDYYYKYNPATGDIHFARPAQGKGWTQVERRTTASRAILKMIRTLPRLSTDEIRAAGLSGRGGGLSLPTLSLPALPSMPSAQLLPPTINPLDLMTAEGRKATLKRWMVPAAVVITLVAITVLTAPKRRASSRASSGYYGT